MDIVLFRHGIAVEPDEWKGGDDERPLTPKGAAKTRQAAVGLKALGIEPTHIWASPLVRAQETAKLLREAFKWKGDVRVCEELRPEASPDSLLGLLSDLPGDVVVLCVGHEPHLSGAAGLMLCGKPVSGLAFKKAGAACIRYERTPKAGHGALRWWMTPAQLKLCRRA